MKVPIKAFAKGLLMKASNNSSGILTGLAISADVAAVIGAFKVAPKAKEIMETRRLAMEKLQADLCEKVITEEEFKKHKKGIYISFAKDMAKACWPVYVPLAIGIGGTLAAHKIDTRKQAELAAALALKDDILNSYRDRVKEEVGEKKEQEIRDSVFDEKVKDGPKTDEKVFATNHGSTLCYDAYNDRWFTCSVSYIREKVAEINEELISQCPIPVKLNELYSKLDLPSTKSGERLGWSIGNKEIHWSNEFVRLTRDTGIDDDNNLYFILDFEDELQGI